MLRRFDVTDCFLYNEGEGDARKRKFFMKNLRGHFRRSEQTEQISRNVSCGERGFCFESRADTRMGGTFEDLSRVLVSCCFSYRSADAVIARSLRANSIHASNLDVNDANKAQRAARLNDLADEVVLRDH